MNNKAEVQRWLKDAGDYLKEAERAFSEKGFRAATQNAQLCIETSCKGVISYFSEPVWTHSPAKQLMSILDTKKDEASGTLGQELVDALILLSNDANFAGPWHGLSNYGEVRDGIHYPAVDICTEEIAHELLSRARRAFQAAEKFFQKVT